MTKEVELIDLQTGHTVKCDNFRIIETENRGLITCFVTGPQERFAMLEAENLRLRDALKDSWCLIEKAEDEYVAGSSIKAFEVLQVASENIKKLLEELDLGVDTKGWRE